ncbi:Crp/Fnr family transcriptional regulator [Methylopila henanensis]|uniref:Crp/Fnr family transcriptional regulator n=1 Tax=Methylopila henanensis TaxID=873516 RepID=A0ABW4KBU8_9HYPH
MRFIETLKTEHLRLPEGADIILPEQEDAELFTVYSGWVFRYKELRDGRRQILNFALPGDLIGLQASLFEKALHGAVALTDVELCVIPRRKLWQLYEKMPEVAYDVTWLGAQTVALVDENLLSAGRRNAAERIAALVASLYKRMETLGAVRGNSMAFPLTQQHIADALGLSLVHTNKTLAKLKSSGLFSIADGRLTLDNPRAVGRLAQHFEKDMAPRPII